ncbi:MAG TPA: AbrB/MazE/SpoVT family DNA-binding domain-containing protein [Nitrosarchaeum sp.]
MSEATLKTVNVSEKGQIAIPREIRILLGIKKGDRLVLTAKNEKILIQGYKYGKTNGR